MNKNEEQIGSNYSDLTRPKTPKGSFLEGKSPAISWKSTRLAPDPVINQVITSVYNPANRGYFREIHAGEIL